MYRSLTESKTITNLLTSSALNCLKTIKKNGDDWGSGLEEESLREYLKFPILDGDNAKSKCTLSRFILSGDHGREGTGGRSERAAEGFMKKVGGVVLKKRGVFFFKGRENGGRKGRGECGTNGGRRQSV